jgi:hypothetical protein
MVSSLPVLMGMKIRTTPAKISDSSEREVELNLLRRLHVGYTDIRAGNDTCGGVLWSV